MLPPEYEEKRLKALWTSTIESASKINLQASQVSSDLGKDKTHYFEKIAFGSGATIAAVVSFIGVHSDELHPRCLLRSILVLLALTMVGALYRNWRFDLLPENRTHLTTKLYVGEGAENVEEQA